MATIYIFKNIVHRLHGQSTLHSRLEEDLEDSPKTWSRRRKTPLPRLWFGELAAMAVRAEVKQEVVGGHGYHLASSDSTSPLLLLHQGHIHFEPTTDTTAI